MAETWTPPVDPWPDYELAQKVLVTEFESGKVKTKRLWASEYTRYDLPWINISTTDKETIEAFWQARDGAYDYFLWTPKGGVQGNYIFDPDFNPRFKQTSSNTWDVTMRVREVPI